MKHTRSRKPNILIIESDSLDGRAMGCMGHPAAHTPHMDRLAELGHGPDVDPNYVNAGYS